MTRSGYTLLLFILLLFPPSAALRAQEATLDNETIWYSRTFSADYVSGVRSMADGAHYTSLVSDRSGTSIVKFSYKSGEEVERLLNGDVLPNGYQIGEYSFNSDENKILVASEVEGIYRHSTKAHYTIYDRETKKTIPVSDHALGKIRLATFSPKGDKVAFVRKNNIYIQDLTTGEERAVTTDGEMNRIINGATDWVYEEEFGFDRGLYWSTGGNYLAYYRFDESEVKEMQMAMYGELYPEQYTFKYPKAGEDNSSVKVFIHAVEAGSTQEVMIEGDSQDHYIPRIKWTPTEGVLSLMKMNRHQNELQYMTADVTSARGPKISPKVFYTETNKTYLEVNDNLIFLEKDRYILTSDRDGYNHIYVMDMKGNVVTQVTSGEWDVIEFSGFDKEKKRVYYTSSEDGAIEKQVYSIGINSKGKKKLSSRTGYNEADFSQGYKYYILYHSDANTPYRISLHSGDGKEIRVLVDNAALKATMDKTYDFQPKEFFTFTTERGDELNGWMIKPKDFDENKEYPVLMAIYGGPGHNTVTNSFGGSNLYWHQLLAQKGYIVVSVDPRGTYYRGRDFKNSTYLQLGKLETEDMISAAKYLGGLKYIDAERIGMQGWSFGGYLTSSCMTKGADVFKMGIAVAPVTNWRYYDTIYTERFMRTPQENAEGYDDNSPINHVEKLKGPYLLVHGSADDNVHYQNTMEMINALVAANKQFDLFIYPDRNHGIYGGTTRLHLFNKMTSFIEDNL